MVTNNGEGGGRYKTGVVGKFNPYEKGDGVEEVLAMLKGGHNSFGVVFTR